MSDATDKRPKLRPVEAFPEDGENEDVFVVRDPSGLGDGVLRMSEPALFVLSQLDGTHTLGDIRDAFQKRYGQTLTDNTLAKLVENLESSHLLEGPSFDAHFASLVDGYRDAPVRASIYGVELGDKEAVEAYMDEMLPSPCHPPERSDLIVGVIAPHLDYPRGKPCYREAYGSLWGRACPQRCVILGTNHFGLSTSVTATGKAFQTPLGVTQVDTEFLEAVERRCGHDLRRHEFDHRREHSIELQVLCLQHVFGTESFMIVPFLCPDPCGPTGMKPFDGDGVALDDFARALTEAMKDDGGDTLVVAGADLSHVGREFGDSFTLDQARLTRLENRDRTALAHLESRCPEAFIDELKRDDNPTRVCSAGCMSVLAMLLPDAEPTLHKYHQAYDEGAQICVTCTAITYAR